MFGGNKLQREYKSIIDGIGKGDRREPKHNPPASVEADGTALLRPEHRIVWDDFGPFAKHINIMMHGGPFSFEEMPKVQFGFDGPDYGRHYQIWYNHVPCGRLVVYVAHLLHATGSRGSRHVTNDVVHIRQTRGRCGDETEGRRRGQQDHDQASVGGGSTAGTYA
ncbi:hypothetical protein [Devosia elaeis]|uniref:hypothetical protein n=1 Tax=Devosia elaeis TaxID=1770058 RepID=UPI0010426F0E|nr:hypothetical protein [Devosia elaeis]